MFLLGGSAFAFFVQTDASVSQDGRCTIERRNSMTARVMVRILRDLYYKR
jgi:hypothetical protein